MPIYICLYIYIYAYIFFFSSQHSSTMYTEANLCTTKLYPAHTHPRTHTETPAPQPHNPTPRPPQPPSPQPTTHKAPPTNRPHPTRPQPPHAKHHPPHNHPPDAPPTHTHTQTLNSGPLTLMEHELRKTEPQPSHMKAESTQEARRSSHYLSFLIFHIISKWKILQLCAATKIWHVLKNTQATINSGSS